MEPRPAATIPVDVAGSPERPGSAMVDRREPTNVRTPVLVAADEEP
jgi:hypothetical protein